MALTQVPILATVIEPIFHSQFFILMAKHTPTVPFATTIMLNPTSEVPLYRQLYDGLREAILSGRLSGKSRLPSTRTLSDELNISRNTVMTAFEQLLAEGYLEGRIGAGTYVASVLPEELLQAKPKTKNSTPPVIKKGRSLSERGKILAATPVSASRNHGSDLSAPRAFQMGLPAVDLFPFEIWARLMGRRWRRPPFQMLGYGEPAGYRPLREAIAGYLGSARAVRCSPEQVIVVGGSQQALDLTVRLLLDPGDSAWIEDPCYLGARGAFLGAGAKLIPVPVDDEGINVAVGVSRCPTARIVYVTPSHQFPLGVTMSLGRRLALLEWASRTGAWVVEDDYDSEFRYAGRPLAALQGLDSDGRVIYIGTFSKVLLPSLRLGYLVVPPDLVDSFVAARALSDRHSPQLEQAVLTDFITEGHFARHIRSMRSLYAERQGVLLDAVKARASGLLTINHNESGMHVVGRLPENLDDRQVAHEAGLQRITTSPLSTHALEEIRPGGLMLGYTSIQPKELTEGVVQLVKVLEKIAK